MKPEVNQKHFQQLTKWNRMKFLSEPTENIYIYCNIVFRYIVHDNICHMERKINYFIILFYYYLFY